MVVNENTPEGQNWVSRTQIAQMSIETEDIEELNAASDEEEEVIEQVWIALAAPKIMGELESYQSEEIVCTRDKDVEEGLQLAEDELEIQCIWETFLQTQKDMVASGEMQEIAGHVDSCYANSEPGRLHGTGPWYLDTVCSRHMTNKKDLFIGKLQPNATKLECANGQILISGRIGSVRLSCIDENRNPLTTRVDDVLYSPQAHSNLMSLGQLSEKGIDFKAVGDKMTLHRLGKTVATRVQIGRVFLLNSLRWSSKVLSSKRLSIEHLLVHLKCASTVVSVTPVIHNLSNFPPSFLAWINQLLWIQLVKHVFMLNKQNISVASP